MANNRLYLYDPATGAHVLLAKSLGDGWYLWLPDHEAPSQVLELWLEQAQDPAAYGNVNTLPTTLGLLTESQLQERQAASREE